MRFALAVSVSVKRRLRTLLCCAILEAGVLFGVPMRPEQIRELREMFNRPKIAQTGPQQTANRDNAGAVDAAAR